MRSNKEGNIPKKSKRNWFIHTFIVASIALFLFLWFASGDIVGALVASVPIVLIIGFFVAIFIYLISNIPAWVCRLRGISLEEHLNELENKGVAVREDYHATQAVTYEDLNTGCLVHLIDIGKDRILCLNDQYYYDFEPISDDPEINQPRKFSTKSFSLLRHKDRDEVLALYPGHEVFDPIAHDELTDYKKIHDLGIKLNDGEVVEGIKFELISDMLKPS